MHMGKNIHLEFTDKESKLCAGDAQTRYLAWKIKKSEKRTLDWLIMAKGKGLNDQLDS